MMKSILFIGPQGSGKTWKIQTVLSCLNKEKVIEMSMEEFRKYNNKELAIDFDVIAIDPVTRASELQELSHVAEYFGIFFMAATQLTKEELKRYDLSMFHVVELSNGTAS